MDFASDASTLLNSPVSCDEEEGDESQEEDDDDDDFSLGGLGSYDNEDDDTDNGEFLSKLEMLGVDEEEDCMDEDWDWD